MSKSIISDAVIELINSFSNVLVKSIIPATGIETFIEQFKNQLVSSLPTMEEREKIIDSLQKWGEYGWCLIDWASIELYHNLPNSIEEADHLALEYCTDESIFNLISDLQRKIDNQLEYSEAVFCYENEKYTSCSLILFSIIDSMMIRIQEKQENGSRMLAGKYAKELQKSHNNNKQFLTQASCLATLNAIKIYFSHGNDFTNEPQNISNRNFVSHGMNTRPVTKIDCIKLFLIIDGIFIIMENYGLEYKSEKNTEKGIAK